MSQFARAIDRRPRRALLVCAAVFFVVAPALIRVGRSSAGPAGRAQPGAASKTVANVPTGKADAIDRTDIPCTVSPGFTDMRPPP